MCCRSSGWHDEFRRAYSDGRKTGKPFAGWRSSPSRGREWGGKLSDNRRIDERIAKLVTLNLSYDELIRRTASSEDWADYLEGVVDQYQQLLEFSEQAREVTKHLWGSKQALGEELSRISDLKMEVSNQRRFLEGALHGRDAEKKIRATKGAEAVHSKPGGSRDKQKQIRDLWASGKYTSRDICAEQECAALGVSFSTARKALRGTPDPT